MLAITMAMAYALLRAQATSLQTSGNFERNTEARNAAVSGAMCALRELHDASWTGIDSVLAANLTADSGYSVTFTTGDDSLQVGDADYDLWPYRITIASQGYARAPHDPLALATSELKIVVQLIPEAMPDEPPLWEVARQYTAFHVRDGGAHEAHLELLMRVEGPARFQNKMFMAKNAPNVKEPRQQFLADLERMRIAGRGDKRPFDTNVAISASDAGDGNDSSADTILALLGLAEVAIANEPTTSMPAVGAYTSYRLYAGGKEYTVPTLPFTVKNTILEPDPKTNPLGLFYSSSNIRIESNVTLRGTIIDRGDIVIEGANISLSANELPSIDGGTTAVQLPVMVVGDDVDVEHNTQMIVNGSIATRDRFRMRRCGAGTSMTMTGSFLVGEWEVDAPEDWPASSSDWDSLFSQYEAQWDSDGNPVGSGTIYDYFPEFLAATGLHIDPRFLFQPPAKPVTLHWMAAGDPLYAASEPGRGLRWKVVEWTEPR